jgi:hypothetical protein
MLTSYVVGAKTGKYVSIILIFTGVVELDPIGIYAVIVIGAAASGFVIMVFVSRFLSVVVSNPASVATSHAKIAQPKVVVSRYSVATVGVMCCALPICVASSTAIHSRAMRVNKYTNSRI